jgi:hypothetical protein
MQAISLKNSKAMMLAAACSVMLTACGGEGGETSTLKSEPTEGALFSPGDFELYKKPFHDPGECEVITEIVLVNGFAGPMTALNEQVLGLCEIYVPANGRAYDLKVEEGSCGSKRYYGTAASDGSDGLPVAIEVIDNRERVCNDRVAPLVVKETYADGHVAMRYAPVTE